MTVLTLNLDNVFLPYYSEGTTFGLHDTRFKEIEWLNLSPGAASTAK